MKRRAPVKDSLDMERPVSDRFLVEAGRKAVGVAVRVRGGFRFFCSDEAYRKLDGLTFTQVRTLFGAVRQIARAANDTGKRLGRLAPAAG